MKNRILSKINLFIISLILLCITAIAPVYANENTSIVQIPVQQVFDTKYADVDNQFTYVLEPEHDTNPMPVKSQNHRFIWTMKKNSSYTIQIPVLKEAEYSYKIYQIISEKEGYTYDKKSYVVDIHAYYDENNQLMTITIVRNAMGEKTDTVLFKNKYTPNKGSLDRARDFVNTSIYNAQFSYLALAIVSLLTLLMLLMLLIKKEGVHNEK